ncbi:MAG: aminopeptidase P family protein [Anaerolineaceae bacterium]|nr:aminopeptidase P family protein [Anaerolineaceae bacterium]
MLVNVERLQRKMDEQGLDGLVATTLGNVYYFTGVNSDGLRLFPYEHQAYAVVTRDAPTEPIFITSMGLSNQAWMGFGTIREVIPYGKFYRPGPFVDVTLTKDEEWLRVISQEAQAEDTPMDALVSALRKLGLGDKKVGVDELNLRGGGFETLKEKLPGAHFSSASKLLRWVRKVKTPEEIKRLRKVTRIAENALIAALSIAREGVTEYEMAREFERSIVSQGAKPHFTLIRFGRNGIAGEVEPGHTPLKRGDSIWFDLGCFFDGYWADIARIASLGEPSTRARNIYRAVLEGEQQALEKTKAGMTGGEVFDLTVDATRKAGLSHYERHHVGHGIGAEIYEDVMIAPGVTDIIEEGTVVNIETPYYEFGLGAIHVEDPFVVRAGGNELLTKLSRELLVVE